ncbi:serine hydroxymethyltransferase [Holosporaceae bacterium 'Namur']|nr:serine hydroxymethyltransferase [Holosporaceae bacterium 'Namur']
MQQEPFIIEYFRVKNLLKVSAIDPHTKTEVCVFGSASTSKEFITDLAIQKLKYQLNKKLITPVSGQS